MASAVPWLAGALFLQGGGRASVWTLALAIDYLGFVLGWPTPRIGGGRVRTWEFSGRYMAERYQQLLPPRCCCGGSTSTVLGRCWPRHRVLFKASSTRPVCALHSPGHGGRRHLDRRRLRTRHRPSARTSESGVAGGHLRWTRAVPGRTFRCRVRGVRPVSRSRIIGLFSLAALAPAMVPLPPSTAATSVTLVLTGVAVNAIRASKAPPEAPSPPR